MQKRWIILALVLVLLVAAVLIYLISTSGYRGNSLFSVFAPGCVGLIKIDGEIATSSSGGSLLGGGGTVGSEDIVSLIDQAENRDDIKAVVFEINSPGGSVVASREIYEEINNMSKPKVAYFREVAASGGYYVGVANDYIVANPDTLTGSIGVRATVVDMSGLWEKLGLNYTEFKSGDLKDMGSPNRPMTEKEREVFQGIISEIFQEFRDDVVKHRGSKLNTEKFNEVLDARVLTGRQALAVGLVDEVGNEKAALKKAGELSNLGDSPNVCNLEASRSIIQELFGSEVNKVFGLGPSFGIRIS